MTVRIVATIKVRRSRSGPASRSTAGHSVATTSFATMAGYSRRAFVASPDLLRPDAGSSAPRRGSIRTKELRYLRRNSSFIWRKSRGSQQPGAASAAKERRAAARKRRFGDESRHRRARHF